MIACIVLEVEVKTLEIDIYLYHSLERTAADHNL